MTSADLKQRIFLYGNPDFVCLSETHLSDNEIINLKGYKWFGNNRKVSETGRKRKSGGVGILVKNGIFEEYSVSLCSAEFEGILSIKITHKISGYTTTLVSNYLPPVDSPYGNNADMFFNQLLIMTYDTSEDDSIIFCGDINARIGLKEDVLLPVHHVKERQKVDEKVNAHGHSFLEFLNDACCCIINGRVGSSNYTFCNAKGKSEIDYVFVPYDVISKITYFEIKSCEDIITELDISSLICDGSRVPDHSMLIFEFKGSGVYVEEYCKGLGAKYGQTQRSKIFRKFKQNYMTNPALKRELLQRIEGMMSELATQSEIDECYEGVVVQIQKEMAKNARTGKRANTPNKPYWNERLSELWHHFDKCAKKLRNFKHHAELPKICSEYCSAMQDFDRELRKCKRNYDRGTCLEIDEMCKKDPKKFWNELNKLGPRKAHKTHCEALDCNGEVTRETETVVKHWFKCYRDHSGQKQNESFDDEFYDRALTDLRKLEKTDVDIGPSILNEYITKEEVSKVVFKGKKRKAVGIDNIAYEALQNDTCVHVLHGLFNKCFDLGKVPTEWSKAIVVPISKGKKSISTEPLTFRGISLQSCIYKIYSGVLNNRVYSYFESEDKLSNCQNGFRKNRSCIDHVFSVTELIRSKITQKKKIYGMFVDYKSAFDLVDHGLLMYSLRKMGISGKMIRAYQAIYAAPCSAINVNGILTPFFRNMVGTRQGDQSSPNLFGSFLQSLLDELENSGLGIETSSGDRLPVFAYADDILLLAESVEELQKLSDIVYEWSRKWRMVVNLEKTKIVVFRGRRVIRPDVNVKYGGRIVEVVEGYRYLGVYLDENLTFDEYVTQISSAGGHALGGVMNKCHLLKDMGYTTFDRLYHSGVSSVLDYGAEVVWLPKKSACLLEKVQQRACRYFLGVGRFSALCTLNAEMGWMSCASRSLLSKCRFYNRLLKMEETRIPRKIFMETKDQPGSWAGELLVQLDRLGEARNWHKNVPLDLANVKEKIQQRDYELWCNEIQTKRKLDYFRTVKFDTKVTPLVRVPMPKSSRSLLSRLRNGSLMLRIEYGRYNREQRDERICELCNDGVEDANHFLYDCKALTEIRLEYADLISNPDNIFEQPHRLGGYVTRLWKKRCEVLSE